MHDGLLLHPSNVMQFVGGFEWIIIIVLVVIVIFGAKKIPELARGFGRAKTEFEKAKVEAERELHNIKENGMTDNTTSSRDKLESIADTLGIDYTNKDDESLRLAIEKELNKGEIV
jgi:sec-independent protein translocase protein TatA